MAQDPVLEILQRRLQDQSDREFVLQQTLSQVGMDREPAQPKPQPVRYDPNRPASEQAPPPAKGGLGAKFQRLFSGGTDYDKYAAALQAENERLRTRLLAGQAQEQEATRSTRVQAEIGENIARAGKAGTEHLQNIAVHSDQNRLLKLQTALETQHEQTKLKGMEAKAAQPGVEERQLLEDAALAQRAGGRGNAAQDREEARQAEDFKLVTGLLTQRNKSGGALSNVAKLYRAFTNPNEKDRISPEEAAQVYSPAMLEQIKNEFDDLEFEYNPFNPATKLGGGGTSMDKETRRNVSRAIGEIRQPFDQAYAMSQVANRRAQAAQAQGQAPASQPASRPTSMPSAPATQGDALRQALQQMQFPAQNAEGLRGPDLAQIGAGATPDLLNVLSALEGRPGQLEGGASLGRRPMAFGQPPALYSQEMARYQASTSPFATQTTQPLIPWGNITPQSLGAFPLASGARDMLYKALKGGGDAQQAASILMLGLGTLQEREQLKTALMLGQGLQPDSIAIRAAENDPVYQAAVMRTLQNLARGEATQPVKR